MPSCTRLTWLTRLTYLINKYHSSLVGLIYQIRTCVAFDYREYVFEQFIKHVESYTVKLKIGFHSLICGILSGHKSDIVTREDEVDASPSVLTIIISCLSVNMLLTLSCQ